MDKQQALLDALIGVSKSYQSNLNHLQLHPEILAEYQDCLKGFLDGLLTHGVLSGYAYIEDEAGNFHHLAPVVAEAVSDGIGQRLSQALGDFLGAQWAVFKDQSTDFWYRKEQWGLVYNIGFYLNQSGLVRVEGLSRKAAPDRQPLSVV